MNTTGTGSCYLSDSQVTNDNSKFSVSLNVAQFAPEELKVNITGNELTVEGHHEEKNDEHGTIQRLAAFHFLSHYHTAEQK